MPNIIDFKTIQDVKEIPINVEGWVSPIYIEYGVGLHNNVTPSYFWKIKETKHTFIIPVSRFHYLSRGEYSKHFILVLTNFRDEYITWKNKDFNEAPWQKEYEKEYKKLII